MKKYARLMCGASGIDIGNGWGLFVSASDNDLGIDRINPDGDDPLHNLPMPTDSEVYLAKMVVMATTVLNRRIVANELIAERDTYPKDSPSWKAFNAAVGIARGRS